MANRRLQIASSVLGLALLSGTACAQNLFVISGTSNGNAFTPVGGDNLVDLVTDAVNNDGQFAALANTNAVISVNYGGVADAINVQKNAANDFATLSFINADGTRTTRTFDANASGRPLEDLIRDYLQQNGADDLKSFFQAINAQSLIAVSDGNPNATTARMANYAWDRFGRYNHQTSMWTISKDTNERSGSSLQFRLGVSGESFTAGDFDGTSAMVETSLDWNFSPYVGTSLGSFLAYNSIGDANIYHGGINFGVPIRPLLPSEKVPLTLQITPSFTVGGSGSEEIAAGGLIYSGAVTGLLRWDIVEKLAIDFSAQYGFYEGQQLSFGDFTVDPGVSQQIFKSGASVEWTFSENGWYLYGGASMTKFAKDAAVDSYLSPDIGVGWKKASGTGLELGFTGDYGKDYHATGLRFGLNVAF